MTSADVVYTFDRLKASGIPYAQNRFPTLTSVTAQGPRAVRFTLSKADPGFLLNMGDPFTVACAILTTGAGKTEDHYEDGRHRAVRDGVYAPTRQLS
jgi:ABC-type transport system substrate-binding protein